jgi:hypothetical protein
MQRVVTPDEIFTVGVTGCVTCMFMLFVAVVGEAQLAFEVSVQLTKVLEVILEIVY